MDDDKTAKLWGKLGGKSMWRITLKSTVTLDENGKVEKVQAEPEKYDLGDDWLFLQLCEGGVFAVATADPERMGWKKL